MSVLVTGGAGYIGSHMVWALLDAGEDVVVLDRLSTGFDWAVPGQATLIVGEVGDERALETLFQAYDIDAVMHFAGSIVVPESVADPLSYYKNNTSASRTLIEHSVKAGVKHFVFSSTAAVYGASGQEPVRETAVAAPESPYGWSKLMTEQILADASAAHDLEYAVLRYFNVSGADPDQRTGQSTKGATHLIKVACEVALGMRDRLEIFGTDYPTSDGTCVRDYIHVTDLVDAHLLALRHLRGGKGSLTANCGYGQGFSVREVVEAVSQVIDRELPHKEVGRRAGDPASIVADAEVAREVLGWTPRHDKLSGIVTAALQWEQHLLRRNR
ncbi:MAG: UDP-glucose 4-epimerase GalE [Pseudomonadota bacterium]